MKFVISAICRLFVGAAVWAVAAAFAVGFVGEAGAEPGAELPPVKARQVKEIWHTAHIVAFVNSINSANSALAAGGEDAAALPVRVAQVELPQILLPKVVEGGFSQAEMRQIYEIVLPIVEAIVEDSDERQRQYVKDTVAPLMTDIAVIMSEMRLMFALQLAMFAVLFTILINNVFGNRDRRAADAALLAALAGNNSAGNGRRRAKREKRGGSAAASAGAGSVSADGV